MTTQQGRKEIGFGWLMQRENYTTLCCIKHATSKDQGKHVETSYDIV
jgi:hypothetical protein